MRAKVQAITFLLMIIHLLMKPIYSMQTLKPFKFKYMLLTEAQLKKKKKIFKSLFGPGVQEKHFGTVMVAIVSLRELCR